MMTSLRDFLRRPSVTYEPPLTASADPSGDDPLGQRDDRTDDHASSRVATDSWWRRPQVTRSVAAFAVLFLVGLGLYRAAFGGGRTADVNHEGQVLRVSGTHDSFDRPDDPTSLGAFSAGLSWRVETGRWWVRGTQAAAVERLDGPSLAVVRVGNGDGAVEVRLPKVTDGAGVVFRYRDPLNYWSVVAAPYYGTWAVRKMVNGENQGVGDTGLSGTADDTTVAVRMMGDVIDVALDGQVARTITDGYLRDARLAGMMVAGGQALAARFDDFRAALPGDQPLLTLTPRTSPTATATPGHTVVPAPLVDVQRRRQPG